MPKGRQHSSKQDKIAWLLAHQSLWEGMSQRSDRLDDVEQKNRLAVLCDRMKATSLFSPNTSDLDVQLSIFNLIQEARKVRRQCDQ